MTREPWRDVVDAEDAEKPEPLRHGECPQCHLLSGHRLDCSQIWREMRLAIEEGR